MDLIFMDSNKVDIGILQDYELDLAYGKDENNFECVVSTYNNNCRIGDYLYFEGSEYGGIIDSIEINTDNSEVRYTGRTWQGILDSKTIRPDSGEDYLTISGEANSVLGVLITRLGLGDIFDADTTDSEITITSYKMDRYIGGYDGICKMLKSVGAKLIVTFRTGSAVVSAKKIVNYAEDEQFDQDQIDFDIKANGHPINHVICLGSGELADRTVIDLYADANGNISQIQTFTGMDEIVKVLDYPNAESDAELIKSGTEVLKDAYSSSEIDLTFNNDSIVYDIGDIIGATERISGISVTEEITKKIVKIEKYKTQISYKVGGN